MCWALLHIDLFGIDLFDIRNNSKSQVLILSPFERYEIEAQRGE